MQIGQTRRLAVLGLLCVALGLAGCDGSAEPKQKFSPTSTFSDPRGTGSPAPSTPSVATTGPNVRPGEKPPVLPPGAKSNTPGGALLFAAYWIEALDWGYATTDSTLARTLYAASCNGCARFLQNIIDLTRKQHQSFHGGRLFITATDLRPTDHHAGATAVVDVTVQQSAMQVLDDEHGIVESAPAIKDGVFRTWVRWDGRAWLVVDWKHAVVK